MPVCFCVKRRDWYGAVASWAAYRLVPSNFLQQRAIRIWSRCVMRSTSSPIMCSRASDVSRRSQRPSAPLLMRATVLARLQAVGMADHSRTLGSHGPRCAGLRPPERTERAAQRPGTSELHHRRALALGPQLVAVGGDSLASIAPSQGPAKIFDSRSRPGGTRSRLSSRQTHTSGIVSIAPTVARPDVVDLACQKVFDTLDILFCHSASSSNTCNHLPRGTGRILVINIESCFGKILSTKKRLKCPSFAFSCAPSRTIM